MARTLTIRIKPAAEVLKEFRGTFKALQAGRPVGRREGIYFTSIEAARNLLTPRRLAMLRAVRVHRPRSIYELARLVDRDLKNVQDDLRVLERYGLVRLTDGHSTGKRRVRVPRTPFGEIALKIAI
jgi:predicted transcriptional regulator